ncbi:MAG: hypothetical protein LAT53_10600 [Idiomarina sp.]|nr:hypothetical protein [Idiomarina sp.]
MQALCLRLPNDYPSVGVTEETDVLSLIATGRLSELSEVPICIDQFGVTRSIFGENRWDCSAYAFDKGSDKNQREFDFTYLSESPELKLQAKLIAYGWLFKQGHYSGAKAKLSTLTSRFNIGLKRPLLTCLKGGYSDLSKISDNDIWVELESLIKEQELTKRTVELVFSALLAVERLNFWLPFNFALPNINFKQRAAKLASQSKLESRQTLAIPQSLTNILYGEAIRFVEVAWPYRKKLTQMQRDLQTNYDIGRATVDYKIAIGKWKWLTNPDGTINTRRYEQEINKATPQSQEAIISQALCGTNLLPESEVSGSWFTRWRSLTLSACFVCCGAFTGMRVSELFELRADSFYTHSINGQVFYSLRGATHKLAAGKKNEEWLASPVVKKAIALALALTAAYREELFKIAAHTDDKWQAYTLRQHASCLWLTKYRRQRMPAVISRSKWNDRLKNYSKEVGAIVDKASLEECQLLNPRDGGAITAKVKLNAEWPLATHQFRRTFACFSIRNSLAHSVALKQQFKHVNLRMSEWYGNGAIESRLKDVQVDTQLVNLLNQIEIENATDKYHNWFNGDKPLSGTFGKAIVSMRDDKPVIYSSWDNLYRLVKEKRLTLHGTLHSYCKNNYDCDMDGVVNPAFCVDCKTGGSVIDSEKAIWWQERHSALTSYLRKSVEVSAGEYAHCITQIRAAERVLLDHDLAHETYVHPIQVIEI